MRTYRILLRNHFYGVRHSVSKLHEQPLIKILLIGGFSIGWLLCLSWLFYEGFDFMYNLGGAGFLLIPRLFTLFFLGLGFMLVLSGAVTGYSNLFQSAEVRRLLTWPVPLKDLFYYKFIQTCWMSSWAFIFIIMPFIGAFGVYRKWPLMMVFWSLAYSIPFVMIFSGLGFLFVLIFIRWAPRGKLLAILGILSLLAIVVWAFGYAERMQQQNAEDMIVLVRMIPGLELASNRILPNWWMSQGILAIARGELGRGMWFLLLLSSSVPVLLFVTAWIGERIFYTGLQVQLAGKGNLSDHPSLLSRFVQAVTPGRGSLRAYLVKDGMIFLRDPSQWTQFLIFFGLLGIYFLNLGSLGYDDLAPHWTNLIAFLNMFSLSAVMSSLSSRFVFPQLSMEGRTLWLVGLAPQSLSRLMMHKFIISSGTLLFIGTTLSTLSNAMLDIPHFSRVMSLVLMPCVAIALSGMSTGLGAVFMETEAKSPAQILSGYGGTLNLILTLISVILLVLAPGMVSHAMVMDFLNPRWVPYALHLTIAYILLLSLIVAGLPLWMGHRALSRRDF